MADKKKIATREAYGNALAEFGGDERILVLDADLSKSTKTECFKKKYPERFINMGIAEANMISTAAGLATCGKIVFASSFAMFAAGRAFEQVRNSVCYPNLNVKVCATHAGVSVGEDGATHQALEDVAIMRALPNMTVISPCDAVETRAAIKAAIDNYGPFYVRLGRLAVEEINDADTYKFELGKGVTLKEGTDVTLIATGLMVGEALKAQKILAEENISARVINIHTIKPIDKDIIIKAAKETGALVSCEEHNVIGGLGSAVAEVLCGNFPAPLIRIGTQDVFGKSGVPKLLLEEYHLTAKDITEAAKKSMALKK
ncbi:transketolase family protein [Qingrenia yutianensis]|uniref:Transketolase family protein n=1 Tax=Qingrenia yutianensis TaxID=2763676 RepID=A0A926FD31_9FIRM|nr:transketolase family protein [Qingrenia yutianensis]MBC8596254.1 transketolase family protein [Qingrenia yutianensis]